MADVVENKRVKIVLDKERTLFYSMSGFLYLAEKYGDVSKVFEKFRGLDSKTFSFESLTAIVDTLYAGLLHEDHELTPERVADLVDINSLKDVYEKMMRAINGNLPEPKEGDDPTKAGARKNGHGHTS